jgi:hypothetical protein
LVEDIYSTAYADIFKLMSMKNSIVVAALFISFVGVLHAEMKVPRSIHRMDELEEAIVKATKKEKPLVFVYTDPGTS